MSSCPVCLENFPEKIQEDCQIFLNCFHSICLKCLKKLKAPICPLCRAQIQPDVLEQFQTKKEEIILNYSPNLSFPKRCKLRLDEDNEVISAKKFGKREKREKKQKVIKSRKNKKIKFSTGRKYIKKSV